MKRSLLSISVGVVVFLAPIAARADLPTPRLIPELSQSKDSGVDSAPEPDPWSTRKKTVSLLGGAPGGPTGVAMGFPVSFGPYEFSERQQEHCDYVGCGVGFRTTRTWAFAVWGHLEPNVEIRLNPEIALRLYGGYSKILNSDSDRCASTLATGCPSSIGEQRLYGGLGLGYAW